MNWLWVAFGGAVGAPLRYVTDRAVNSRLGVALPWGTLLVNLVGSLFLGVLTGLAFEGLAERPAGLLLGTGLCGALTTYSTFSQETLRLAERGRWRAAGYNVVANCVSSLGAFAVGLLATRALAG